LHMDYPRMSDLAISLFTPQGSRVLLSENRGGTNLGFGATTLVTNATARAQAKVTTTARTMRRVLLVRGWWWKVNRERKFKIQNSKCKTEFKIAHFILNFAVAS